MNPLLRRVVQVALPVVVIAAGVAVFRGLLNSKPAPVTRAANTRGTLVTLLDAVPSQQSVAVRAQGSVIPSRELSVVAQVSGKIVWQNPALVLGGRMKKGSRLIRIDPRDYSLAAKQRAANVNAAELQLEVERSRQRIAADEWKIIGEAKNATDEGRALALRQPQLKSAEASLSAAESSLSTAQLALTRTTLKVPFDCIVTQESVELDQVIAPGRALATLVATDRYWVQVSIPVASLGSLRVPGIAGAKEGSTAAIRQSMGDEHAEWSGTVLRLLGELDPVGRMARIVIEIIDPQGANGSTAPNTPPSSEQSATKTPQVPLLLGAYVTVEIAGGQPMEVFEIPRHTLREGDKVYVYSKGTLEIRPVSIAGRRKDTVLVSAGLRPGDQIITSRLGTVLPGMALRLDSSKANSTAGVR